MPGQQDVPLAELGKFWLVYMCWLASCVVAGTFELCMCAMQAVLGLQFDEPQPEAKQFYVYFLWFVDRHRGLLCIA